MLEVLFFMPAKKNSDAMYFLIVQSEYLLQDVPKDNLTTVSFLQCPQETFNKPIEIFGKQQYNINILNCIEKF